MEYSYKILSAFGIDIELHLFFLIFIAIMAFFNPFVALMLILIFGYVTLHELSHCFVAKRNNIKVKKIILLPIGGMAMMDVTNIKPITEIKMALAGPLFNLLITYFCLVLANIYKIPLQDWLTQLLTTTQPIQADPFSLFIFFSFYANWLLGAFNLLVPAFPLDGGRIFRALLAIKLDYLKATRIARNVSLAIALFFFMLGIFSGDLWLMFIAFFVAFAATGEYEATVLHNLLAPVKTSEVVSRKFLKVRATDSVSKVAEKMAKNIHPYAFLSTKAGPRVIDVNNLAEIPAQKKKKLLAQDVAKQIVPGTLEMNVEDVLKSMNEQGVSTLPIASRGRLVGVVHKTDLEKMIQIKKAMDGRK